MLPGGDYHKPLSARLSGLSIGALTLSPGFDPDVAEYAAATTSATNKVTATPEDARAAVAITVNGAALGNGSAATWSTGENVVTITVTNGSLSKAYTVTVTK